MKYSKVLVGGCFNSIHSGHIYFLKEAKKLGNMLVVVLAHDKNNDKPYAVSAEKHKEALEFLDMVDEVVIGNVYDKIKIVREIKPDVIALGYDQILPKDIADFRYVNIKKFGNYSTKNVHQGKRILLGGWTSK